MEVVAHVYEPLYDYNDKRYIRFTLEPDAAKRVSSIHYRKQFLLKNQNIDDPLDGNVLKVKVPYRYRRVMCEVKGKPIQSLTRGDQVKIKIEFKGVWNVENYSGFSWILSSSSF